MEDRKRPADDSGPPAKRQATAVNGRAHQDDVPWKDDIEAYQKDAILRQMREYKREKVTVEARLRDIESRSEYHDDHLRILDSWFDQLIDEIRIRCGGSGDLSVLSETAESFPSALLHSDNDTFHKHLSCRKQAILSSLSTLFTKFPVGSPDVADLQQRLSKLLAKEKEHIVELQRIDTEKQHMSDRLDTATHRYMIAEKKIDRLKSAQVQKLESQAMAGGAVKEESSGPNGTEGANGIINGAINEELQTARDAAIAEAAKKKEQLAELESKNKELTEEVTGLQVKLTGLSDDDYAKTDLFKVLKSQHEEVIKRVNHLEATNIQLREEAKKFQAERTEYRIKVDDEARATVSESESNVARAEADLARIRHNRDELLAKVSVLEASLQNNQTSRKESNELVNACDSRIAALEAECERLRLQLAEISASGGAVSSELENMSPEQMRSKIASLESQTKLLSNELPAMENAWKKAQAVASKKVAEIAAWEENIGRTNADKAKADQKYFAAMKAKETLAEQNRVLRSQVSKSTEIVAQLKDADTVSRTLVDKLEKQCAEMRAQMEELSVQHRALQQKVNENALTSSRQDKQVEELKKLLETKNTTLLSAKHAQRESESERDKMAAQVHGLEKQCEHWKKKSGENQSDFAQSMQQMLQCQVCKTNFKDTVIKTCGHVFCDKCVQDRLVNRARKCPNCGKAFGGNDIMRIHL
ncbi:E3 ubiquitin-protein ligase bre1 [Sporormia fimetaria CBS 119925]|uniref:E3 ubiquitin protein ligase n=1 Tax=Sporormia fimetaria CBS 119925 TaxID=1340428 RepID=A0A6A6VDB2_9PLEO|nr:E3 ubiquitin-protein ligase bre1 [Sporormia fimetaria CBS 119925]